jgi:hypothetical protein
MNSTAASWAAIRNSSRCWSAPDWPGRCWRRPSGDDPISGNSLDYERENAIDGSGRKTTDLLIFTDFTERMMGRFTQLLSKQVILSNLFTISLISEISGFILTIKVDF